MKRLKSYKLEAVDLFEDTPHCYPGAQHTFSRLSRGYGAPAGCVWGSLHGRW